MNKMKLSIGFSPCPNDTFIFGALVHGLIDTEGLSFEVVMEDVEALNKRAFAGTLDITKLSYHAFAHLTQHYQLLNAGSALGNNCGPLLVAKKPMSSEEIEAARIAIPGKMTTANFLLGLAFPKANNRVETLFSSIEEAVLKDSCEAGLIIHENRFTYEQKGLIKLMDLGEYWEETTQLPIPLGGIVVRNTLSTELQQKVDRVVRKSIEFAYQYPEKVMPYIRLHAQAMEDQVMQAHIALYVNQFSLDLGEIGRKAVTKLFDLANEKGVLSISEKNFFVERKI